MDQHILPGVKARDVAEAHRRDLLIQDDHRCNCMTYWIDEKRGNVFCLIDAPSADAVTEMHRKAHGLVPHKIIEVSNSLVEAFLGRITDPETAVTEDGLRVFADESFRSILVIQLPDTVLLRHQLGNEKANGLSRSQHYIIQKEIVSGEGSEIKHGGTDYIASFVSAGKAVSCAMSIRDILMDMSPENNMLRIGIHAGDPIMQSDKLFGDAVQLAKILGSLTKDLRVAVSSTVKELAIKDRLRFDAEQIVSLSASDEAFLLQLYQILDEKSPDPGFDMDAYGKLMAMSNSQLYRKTLSLTGQSPNNLLRQFRLDRAREIMKKSTANISQVSFDTGFSSPSYFTKCFKKHFGMLPLEYLEGKT